MKKIIMQIVLGSLIVFAGVAHGSVVKWSQLPSMEPANGYAFSSESQVSSQVADDFMYRGSGLVNQISWWGAYWDSTYMGSNYYPYSYSDGWGDPAPGPETVTGFNITFYQNVAAGTAAPPWAHPGAMIGTASINLSDIIVQNYGVINRAASSQTVFQYDVLLDKSLAFADGETYWISIQAMNRNSDPVQWGWQESSDQWNANAVQIFPGNVFNWEMMPGEDMAFELKAVPVPTSLLLLASGLLGFVRLRRRA